MKGTTKDAWFFSTIAAVLILLMIVDGLKHRTQRLSARLEAQAAEREKPPAVPRRWMGSALEYQGGGTVYQIWIEDYAGVCVYVVLSSINGYAHGPVTSLAVIPKTQLPVGTGCQ